MCNAVLSDNPPEAQVMVMICWVMVAMVTKRYAHMSERKVLGSPERSRLW